MRALIAVLAVLSPITVAYAGNDEITYGFFGRSLRSSSANAVTDDNMFGGQLTYGRELPLGLAPGLALWATAGMTWGDASGYLFQTMSTQVDTLGFTVGGRVAYTLHERVSFGARVDLGSTWTSLELTSNSHSVSDARWAGTASASTHIDLLAIARRRFSFGVRAELGYLTATAPALRPHADADDQRLELDGMQASIGHLDLGGRFFGISLLSQF